MTVEFYRVSPTRCDMFDDQNRAIDSSTFPFQDGSMCNLTCSVEEGIPHSPMRTEAVDNVYVIPVPGTLTPGTATLMAAACCIPAILLLVSMWNTILEKNWQSRFGRQDEGLDDIIEGTNDATLRKMRLVNKRIGSFLALVEALLSAAALFLRRLVMDWHRNSTQRTVFCGHDSHQSPPGNLREHVGLTQQALLPLSPRTGIREALEGKCLVAFPRLRLRD